jgi:uncharacterized protein (TIGR02271 family)
MTKTYSQEEVSGWIGNTVVDGSGGKVGKVSQVYFDDQTGQPEWLAVNTGLFKSRSSFVPLQGTRTDGDQLVVGYDKDMIKGAPQVEDDGDGYLDPAEEQELYSYYGQGYAAVEGQTTTTDEGTDDAMTRSEEQLHVGTTRQEAGRARLRKYVVTEQVQTTVPVSHEEVRLEREPITDENRGTAMSGAALTEDEHEVVLTEERPVVEKEVVPKERVRLGTETVTSEAEVTEEVRKERIEADGLD